MTDSASFPLPDATGGNDEESGWVVGGPVARVRVSLRVIGDSLDPREVTALLRVPPTSAGTKGERHTRHGREVVAGTGGWVYSLPENPSGNWELGPAIDALLARFPSDPEVWERLHALGAADVFCGLFLRSDNEGADLCPETLAALGARGLTLGLDIYGPF